MPNFSHSNASISFASFEQEFIERLSRDDFESIVLILPTRVRVRAIERKIVKALGDRTVVVPRITTMGDFAAALLAKASPNLLLIGDAERAVLVEEAIRSLLSDGKLTYFEGSRRAGDGRERLSGTLPLPRGTFELVVNSIRRLKETGASPEQLKYDLEQSLKKKGETTEIRRSRDILTIYSAYEQKLQGFFTDEYGVFGLLGARYQLSDTCSVEESKRRVQVDLQAAYSGARDIFIDGFSRIEAPSLALIDSLARCGDLRVTVNLEERTANDEVFQPLVELQRQLESLGMVETESLKQSSATETASALHNEFADNLFRIGRSEKELPDYSHFVHSWGAPSPKEEVASIVRTIKLLVARDESVRLDLSRIHVVTPLQSEYTPLFQEAFREYGLPAMITDRYRLESAHLMAGVVALLDMARLGITRRELVNLAASPYLSLHTGANASVDGNNLIGLLDRYRLRGDARSWRGMLETRDAEAARKMDGLDAGDRDRRDLERERDAITRGLRDISAIEAILAPFNAWLTPAEFCGELRNLVRASDVRTNLLRSSGITLTAGTLSVDSQSFRTLLKLIEDIEGLFAWMEEKSQRHAIGYYVERLKTASLLGRFNTRAERGAVLVTSLEQSVGLECDYLFVAGLSDTAIPSRYDPQVFLMGNHQKGEDAQLRDERLLFLNAITTSSKGLYLSWPNRGANGSQSSASSFVNAVRGVVKCSDALPAEFATTIFSSRELMSSLGVAVEKGHDAVQMVAAIQAERELPSKLRESLTTQLTHSLVVQANRSRADASVFAGELLAGAPSRAISDAPSVEETERLEKLMAEVWSITQLETYAKCGWKYFAQYMLRLNGEDSVEEGMEGRERGTLIHGILREYFTEGRTAPVRDLSTDAGFAESMTELRGIADRYLAEAFVRDPSWSLDSEEIVGRDQDEGVLTRFLKRERASESLRLRPAYFEVSFGSGDAPAKDFDPELFRRDAVELNGILYRGRIDRIDLDDECFAIVDYKTGRVSKKKEMERGTSLQLPLYLRIAEDILRSHEKDLHGIAALYHEVMKPNSPRSLGLALKEYCGKKLESGLSRSSIKTDEELQTLIEGVVQRARSYVVGMSHGEFPLVAKDLRKTACSYCAFSSACRVEEASELGLLRPPPSTQMELSVNARVGN